MTGENKGSTAAHQKLVHEVLLAINPFGRFSKYKVGLGMTRSGNMVKFGEPGWPDIIGFLRNTHGTFCGIEIKTGEASQSKEQIVFEKILKSVGGIYIVGRDVDSVVHKLSEVTGIIISPT